MDLRQNQDLPQGEEGTNLRRFLARRGAVVVKETRDIGKTSALYDDTISVSTAVIALVKGQRQEMSYGVRIERMDAEDTTESSVYLDFDEIDEMVAAFDFIHKSSERMRNTERDYTEVTYSTKDNARIGFFHDAGKQQYFIQLQPTRKVSFLADIAVQRLRLLLLKAREHLISRGASAA